jgi:hypothetical protein
MKNMSLTLLFLVILIAVASAAEDEFQVGTRTQIDSVIALRNSVSFLEAGLQRGELEPALKMISIHYEDAGIRRRGRGRSP